MLVVRAMERRFMRSLKKFRFVVVVTPFVKNATELPDTMSRYKTNR